MQTVVKWKCFLKVVRAETQLAQDCSVILYTEFRQYNGCLQKINRYYSTVFLQLLLSLAYTFEIFNWKTWQRCRELKMMKWLQVSAPTTLKEDEHCNLKWNYLFGCCFYWNLRQSISIRGIFFCKSYGFQKKIVHIFISLKFFSVASFY